MANFRDICQFLFKNIGYFSKYLQGYGIPRTPLPEPQDGVFQDIHIGHSFVDCVLNWNLHVDIVYKLVHTAA